MTTIQTRAAFQNFASSLMRRSGPVNAEARLPEGLVLAFARVPYGCQRRGKLVLAREGFFPTTDEVEACCHAFRIPASVKERRQRHFVVHPKSRRRIHAHVVELTWEEELEAGRSHEDSPHA